MSDNKKFTGENKAGKGNREFFGEGPTSVLKKVFREGLPVKLPRQRS